MFRTLFQQSTHAIRKQHSSLRYFSILLSPGKLRYDYDQTELVTPAKAKNFKLDDFMVQPSVCDLLESSLHSQVPHSHIFISGLPEDSADLVKTAIESILEKNHIKCNKVEHDHVFAVNFGHISVPNGAGREFTTLVEKALTAVLQRVEQEAHVEKHQEQIKKSLFLCTQQDILGPLLNELEQDNMSMIPYNSPGMARDFPPIWINIDGRKVVLPELESLYMSKAISQEKYNKIVTRLSHHVKALTLKEEEIEQEWRKYNQDEGKIDKIGEIIKTTLKEHIKPLLSLSQDTEAYFHHLEDSLVELARSHGVQGFLQELPSDNNHPNIKNKTQFLPQVVEKRGNDTCPIVIEKNPTVQKLMGDTTGLTGSINQANGGYLILPLSAFMSNPEGWMTLKRTLIDQELSFPVCTSSTSSDKEFVKNKRVDIKIILLGDAIDFEMFSQLDATIARLFQRRIEAKTIKPNDLENRNTFVSLLVSTSEQPISSDGIAKFVECAVQKTNDRGFIDMQINIPLLEQSTFWARKRTSEMKCEIQGKDVEKSLQVIQSQGKQHQTSYFDSIASGRTRINFTASKIGETIALSIMQKDISYRYGAPVLLSAITSCGNDSMVDIMASCHMAGNHFLKANTVLNSFLHHQYFQKSPLPLHTSVFIEQTVGPIEGDSHSLAAILAVVSSLSGAPIPQNLASTGALSLHGDVTGVGMVSEKIEGFWDAMKHTGFQFNVKHPAKVLIPCCNHVELQLRHDIVQACRDGLLQVHCVENLDEALCIVFDRPADDIHAAVQTRLTNMFG